MSLAYIPFCARLVAPTVEWKLLLMTREVPSYEKLHFEWPRQVRYSLPGPGLVLDAEYEALVKKTPERMLREE
jgi:hypothetical protein